MSFPAGYPTLREWGRRGAQVRNARLSAERRREIASKAGRAAHRFRTSRTCLLCGVKANARNLCQPHLRQFYRGGCSELLTFIAEFRPQSEDALRMLVGVVRSRLSAEGETA